MTAPSLESARPTQDGPIALGSPLALRALTLKNRIIVAPMCMYSAQDGVADDFHLVHLGRFAMGGASLVFTEATAVNAQGRITAGCLGLWNDTQADALARVAAVLHAGGAAAGIQLAHSGPKGSSERPWEGSGSLANSAMPERAAAWDTVGATREPGGPGWPAVHALDVAQIEGIVRDFVAAARRADAAGFDVIELHCAHGYLLHQFLSPLSNTRTDGWGGTLQGRMRFTLEVVEAVRAAWPAHKPLFVRISSVDGVGVGWSLEDSLVLARELRIRGVDVIDCSSGGMSLPRDKVLVARTPGFHLPYSEVIRREAGLPTVAVGLIRDPGFAQGILREGRADLIAVAREALFNPNWANHALLHEQGKAAWAAWPQPHGWWLERRAGHAVPTVPAAS